MLNTVCNMRKNKGSQIQISEFQAFVQVRNNQNRLTAGSVKHRIKKNKSQDSKIWRTTAAGQGQTWQAIWLLYWKTVDQLNSRCPQRPHCLLLSSSSWPCWDSSGKPDCHSAHCSSYGQSASMCSSCLYPARRRKDLRQEQ